MRRRRASVAVCIVVGIVSVASTASAEATKESCIKANADGQALRIDGKLSAARKDLAACCDQGCPPIVREDCAQRLNEVERAQPTIVFEVKDASGADLSAVSVALDGKPLVEKLGGMALPVDPGEHVFTFTASGGPSVSRRFLVREGEKDRRERIVLDAPGATPTPTPTSTPTSNPPTPTPTSPSTQKTIGLIGAGVGVAAIVVGGLFGALTFSYVGKQQTDCASLDTCPNRAQALSDHSNAATDAILSTAGFIAGGALLAGGAILFLASPSASAPHSTGLEVLPSMGSDGAGVSVRGVF